VRDDVVVAVDLAELDGAPPRHQRPALRSEEHTSELQSLTNLVCRLLLEKKKKRQRPTQTQEQTTEGDTYTLSRTGGTRLPVLVERCDTDESTVMPRIQRTMAAPVSHEHG